MGGRMNFFFSKDQYYIWNGNRFSSFLFYCNWLFIKIFQKSKKTIVVPLAVRCL